MLTGRQFVSAREHSERGGLVCDRKATRFVAASFSMRARRQLLAPFVFLRREVRNKDRRGDINNGVPLVRDAAMFFTTVRRHEMPPRRNS